jgi:uncharacterized repeat protein (TIGR01451 family)
VDDSIAAGTDIVNVATIDDGMSPPWTAEDSGVTTESPLGIVKSSPGGNSVDAGGVIWYQLWVSNKRPVTHTFVLTDDMDANTEFGALLSWTGSPTPTVPATGTAGGQITWTRTITPGVPLATVWFSATVVDQIADGTVITNLMSVDDGLGTVLTDVVTHTVVSEALYEVNKSASDSEPDVTDEVGYTIVVENTGGDAGTFLFLDAIPAGTSYVVDSVSDNAQYDPVLDIITATQALDTGESMTFTFAVDIEVGEGTWIFNTAIVSPTDDPGAAIASDWVLITATTTADLSTSSKEGTPDTVVPGELISYVLTLNNTGTGEGSPADLHSVYDAIPDGASFDSWIYQGDAQFFPGGSLSLAQELSVPLWVLQAEGGFVYWEGKVPTTQPVTVSFRVQVDTDATLGQEIDNLAVVGYEGQELELTDVAQVVGTSELSIDKSVDEPLPFAGQQVTYTIRMTNTGDFTLDVSMTDDVGSGQLQVVTGTISGGAVYTDGQIAWDGQVNSGQEIVITYEAVVPDTLQPGDMVTNTVAADYLDQTVSDAVKVTVAADISAAKYIWDGASLVTESDAYPTGQIVYGLMVTNTGVSDADIVLSDEIPDGLGNVIPGPGLGHTDYPVPTVFTDTTVAAGSTVVLFYSADVDEGRMAGEIVNAFTHQTVGGDPITTDPVTVTVQSPLLTSVKAVVPTTANVEDTLQYFMLLINGAPAQDVTATLVDTVPDYTTFITGTEGISYDGGQVTWSGTVAASSAVMITFTAQVDSQVPQYPTEIVNTATVDDGLGNPLLDLGPVTTTVESVVLVNKAVDLDEAYPGSRLQYVITVQAGGSSSVELSDPIPENTTYVPGSVTGGAYDAANDRIYLLTGGDEIVAFQVDVVSPLATPTDIVNTAYITDDTDTMFSVQATTAITSPLIVSKDKVWPIVGPPLAGQLMVWQIGMFNQTAVTTTAMLTDVLPAGLEWITITQVVSNTAGSAGFASGVLTWTGEVGPGLSWVRFPATVTLGLANGTPITNEVQIDDGMGSSLTASGSITVSSLVFLGTSSKSASVADPVPGETVVYTITLNNLGNMDATGITVTDTVPANMTYVDGSASDGGSWDGVTLTWSGLALDAGDSTDVSFEAMVDDGVLAGTPITNTAWISQSTLASAVTPSVIIAVGEQPILVASKSVDPLMPTAGERLTYTIQVANVGNATTAEVNVTDPIPADTTYVPGSVTGAVYEPAGDLIQLTDATLAPAQSLTVTFAVTVDVATRITNTAYITGAGTLLQPTAIAYPAGPLHHIVVSPTAVTLAFGATQQFTAIGYDVDDNIVPEFTPAWSVADPNAGAIDATGVFTAGTIGGYYPDTVVATAESIIGTADVTVEWPNEVFLPLVGQTAP